MTEYVFTLNDTTPRVEITVEPVAAAVADDLYQRARREGFAGTFEEFLAKFKGEKGDEGLPGQPGSDGLPGKNGENGSDGENGKSAYEIAVEQGFKGDKAAWLLSLKGEKGDGGQPGIDGSAATVEIGTVTTGETASVTNSGTANAAVLDFVLPQAATESPYLEYQEGYIAAADFGFTLANGQFGKVFFPKPFSKRPDIFNATLDIAASAARFQYIDSVEADGFSIGVNHVGGLQGVWYRAAVKK